MVHEVERVKMHWIRANIRFGSRLALFALAVQMVLSFGHVHIATPTLASSNVEQPAVADGSRLTLSRAILPIHKSDGSVSDDCAICALIHLSFTSAPPAAPVLPLPMNVGPLGLLAPAQLPLAATLYVLFQARAPPSI
jgi:hypothetical protein